MFYLLPNFFEEIKSIDQAIHAKVVGPLLNLRVSTSWKRLNVENENGSYLLLEHGLNGSRERRRRLK